MNSTIGNKEFKAMIKSHQCKQSFVRIIDTSDKVILNRFYQDTVNNKKYVCGWKIEDGELVRSVFEIDSGVWAYNWHKYTAAVVAVRNNLDETNRMIDECYDKSRNNPMEERKFWKVKAETLQFMLKDKRI